MKTKAVRLYGKSDLRLEEFELPAPAEDEILARVWSDSLCASSCKAARQGPDHKRVPKDCAENPVIIGHEFCGEIIEVGSVWAGQFREGQRFIVQPALACNTRTEAIGYSFPTIGGNATYIVIPREVIELGCVIPYEGPFFAGSMAEPYSCIIHAFHAMYHTAPGCREHIMGTVRGGNMALIAGNGPMGQTAIDYILHADARPSLLVVTARKQEHLDALARLLPVEEARRNGVDLRYFNTSCEDPKAALLALTGNTGYDDVFVFAPAAAMVELGDAILGQDGCLNFFSGPTDPAFQAPLNFYNVHYSGTHFLGTTGGSTDDMKEAVSLMQEGRIHPSVIISHIGGLDAAPEATLRLSEIGGSKKLIYTGIDMPLTAIADFAELGRTDPLFAELDALCRANNGLWSAEAERFLLERKGAL